jgi:hypothetical protein
MASPDLSLGVELDRNPLVVSPTRRYVEDTLERLSDDVDFVGRVGLVTHELIENATKYATEGARIGFTMCLGGSPDGSLVIRLTNPTSPQHIDRLKQFVAEIDGAEDAMTLYMDMMCRGPFDKSASGLGLARICAEGESRLALVVTAETATIVATVSTPPQKVSTWRA